MSVRRPAVAGMFYPANAAQLKEQVESCFLGAGGPGRLPAVNPTGPRRIVGLVSPHAGLMYSGTVAAWAYYRLAEDGLPETAVLIGPNHRSYFPAVALSDESAWHTPMGDVLLDSGIAASIISACPTGTADSSAHQQEHSLEVQLPFLQYIAGSVGASLRIVPILIGATAGAIVPGGELEVVRQLGDAVAGAVKGKNAVIIASTDFTHYETSESAHSKDSQAISSILALDEWALLSRVKALDISMCGALPAAVTMVACKKLGAVAANKLAYRNSGDVTGDYSEVVGYAAVEINNRVM